MKCGFGRDKDYDGGNKNNNNNFASCKTNLITFYITLSRRLSLSFRLKCERRCVQFSALCAAPTPPLIMLYLVFLFTFVFRTSTLSFSLCPPHSARRRFFPLLFTLSLSLSLILFFLHSARADLCRLRFSFVNAHPVVDTFLELTKKFFYLALVSSYLYRPDRRHTCARVHRRRTAYREF